MKNENLIHVKFEYDEALQSKRDVLSLEMSLLKIAKIIKRYHSLRIEELKLRLKLYGRLKEIGKDMKKLQTILPELEIPKILKKGEKNKKIEETKEKQYDESLEFQLKEIQDKLKALQE